MKEITSEKFKQKLDFDNNDDLDNLILELLETRQNPISQETISVILDVEKWRVCKRLRMLEKSGLVRKVTEYKQPMFYWRWVGATVMRGGKK